MNQHPGKQFYSLNLTEGRIFIIFLSIIIFSVIVFFAGAILLSKHSEQKANGNMIYTDTENSGENLMFYDENQDHSNSQITNSDQKGKFAIDEKKADIDNNAQDADKNSRDEKTLVKIDNTTPLYSSSYNTSFVKNSTVKKNTTTSIRHKSTYHKNKTYKTSNANKTTGKRYVIQIGSYLNKEFADDISVYFKQKGYPTYIKEKLKQNKTFYRLRVGPFKDKSKANDYLVSIKNLKYGDKSYISVVYF